MNQVLVTGATGFLGGALCRQLGSERVIATGRDIQKVDALSACGMKVRRVDLSQPIPQSLFEGVSTIVHCAALSALWGSQEAFQVANVDATRRLLEAAAKSDSIKRFIYVSTPSIYARCEDQYNISEDAAHGPAYINDYAASKAEAERVVQEFKGCFDVATIRPQGIVGRGDPSVAPRLLHAFDRKGYLPLLRGGHQRVDLTPVQTVVQALQQMIEHPHNFDGEAFNISGGASLSVASILCLLFEAMGKELKLRRMNHRLLFFIARLHETLHRLFRRAGEPALTVYGLTVLTYGRTLSIDKAKSVFGFSPNVTVREAFEEYAFHLLKTSNDNES